MIAELAEYLVNFVHQFGYWGVFITCFLESTFFPLPSEVTMIPAGYLVQQGLWNGWIVLVLSIAGTVLGSLFNYWIAFKMGRPLLARYGKYMFFGPERMEQLDTYFKSHGEISIFTGRLILGVRHVISFPAGLAKMNLRNFTILTGLGGGIWMATLILVGYFIGGNKDLVHAYMPFITAIFITGVITMIAFYIWQQRRKAAKNVGN